MNLRKMKLLLLIPFVLVISMSCDSGKTNSGKKKEKINSKFKIEPHNVKLKPASIEDLEIDIINSTLYLLAPNQVIQYPKPLQAITQEKYQQRERINKEYRQALIDSLGMTLFVGEELLISSKENIKKLIDQGGSTLLNRIIDKKLKNKKINIQKLKNKNNINLHDSYPVKTDDRERNIGGVNYSRIIFNEDKSKAAFIFHFQRLHNIESTRFCAVEVENQIGNWVIISKVCAD